MQEPMKIFEQGWEGKDTVCGWGSTIEHTSSIRKLLPTILAMTKARTINDAGCGDLFWMQHLDLSDYDYIGYDLYERSTWPALRKKGWVLNIADITKHNLRDADLTMCRDVFIHLPNHLVLDALKRFQRSSKYLLATNFTNEDVNNFDRMSSPRLQHAKLDLRKAPFGLGNPITSITEDHPGKFTSLWKL